MYLLDDPADPSRFLLPVVGLQFADYSRVCDRVTVGTLFKLVPVENNPHDPNAVEVHCENGKENVRVGFVPRDAAPGIRLALSLRVLDEEVPAGQVGQNLALSLMRDVMMEFICLLGESGRRDVVGDPPGAGDDVWPYRAVMPGDSKDLDAPIDDIALLFSLMGRLRAKAPENAALMAAEAEFTEESEYLYDDHLFDVADAVSEDFMGVVDTGYDAACPRDKIGGLPYCEAGWTWPRCPCCNQEMFFLGQSRDPANPDDLIQAFWCVDTVDRECAVGDDLFADDSTVRIWRNPSQTSPITIRPDDPSRIIQGHRLEICEERNQEEAPMMSCDGIANTHFNQCSHENGRHKVFMISLGPRLLDGRGPSAYAVIRHGRGLVTSWEDWG